MGTKVTRFIHQIAQWFKERVAAADPSTWFLVLLNDVHTFDYADEWSDVSALECSFKGYARINLTSLGYGAPAEPTTGKWRTQSLPANFAYNGASGGLSSETAKAWALIEMSGSTENLMEIQDLVTPKLFSADGDVLALSHFFDALNCDE